MITQKASLHKDATHAGKCLYWRTWPKKKRRGALEVVVLRFQLFFRSVFRLFYLKTSFFPIWCLSRFLSISLPVFGKNKFRISDLLFDAVWRFFGSSSENMHLNRLHVFSDFACGFRFWWNLFRFLSLFGRFCGFFYTPIPPSQKGSFLYLGPVSRESPHLSGPKSHS